MVYTTYERTTTNMETITELEQKILIRHAVDEYIAFMNEAAVKFYAERYPSLEPETYYLDSGRKYLRIASRRGGGGGAYVHSFVDAFTGDVYKAAGWKAPALNGARYNLLDAASFEDLKAKWDPHGGYLYKNR
jgi:hypothetical protein